MMNKQTPSWPSSSTRMFIAAIIIIFCCFGIFINFVYNLPANNHFTFNNKNNNSTSPNEHVLDDRKKSSASATDDDLLAWSISPEAISLESKNIFFHHASESLINAQEQNLKWSSWTIEDHFWNVEDILKTGKIPQPSENFTISILTYNRPGSLLATIRGLNKLLHLAKVIVIWNSPRAPSMSLDWPAIHVPIHVYLGGKNSLNNRFLPLDLIETNAVLSLDDDLSLSHDEILFAFRVWRQNQNRIVGFPGRSVGWNSKEKKWTYEHSSYQCYNMVLIVALPGAAFVHKFYYYSYTYEMPKVIRDKVDERLNCEDLAMNFLVSNKTQKPPIKVTSSDDFRCLKCSGKEASIALHDRPNHYHDRSDCINFFVTVYGYMALFISESIVVQQHKGDLNNCINLSLF